MQDIYPQQPLHRLPSAPSLAVSLATISLDSRVRGNDKGRCPPLVILGLFQDPVKQKRTRRYCIAGDNTTGFPRSRE